MSADLAVHQLAKRYGTVEAVRGISFVAAAGQIVGLLGPNGAGKTTTIECILGLRRPDAGSITVAGIDALAHPERIKPLIGAQLQSTALQQKITPRQALRLFASFYRQRIDPPELLDRFDLAPKADVPFDSLSGGQQQRLALALAFVNDPQIVFLDEPTAGLDPAARHQLHTMIRAARGEGRTVVLSTHLLDEAQQLCDAVVIIDSGKVVAAGPPAALIAAASAPARIVVRSVHPLSTAALMSLPSVHAVHPGAGGSCELEALDLRAAIACLMQLLQSTGNDLLDLQIRRPSLEDVYLERTGRAWISDDASTPAPPASAALPADPAA